jgi:DNA-binding GntR family transcriptional regulator
MMFSVKREESLRAQAAQQVRDAIVTGKLAPGTMHSEQTIAAEMGISRTPVREALLQLAGEGLVEFVPHRGVRISRLDLAHLVSVLEYRAALESYCAVGLAKNPRAEVLAALDAQIVRQRQIIEAADRLRWVTANMEFHRILVDSLGNRLMSEAFPALAAHTMRIGYRMISRQERMQESVDEHLAVVNAIRHGNVEEARRLAAEHLYVTKLLMKQLFDDLKIDATPANESDRARA